MLLEISGLTKTYRRGARANDGIDLAVDAGEVYGLLGHNGAGKTTLVNQVVGLLRPDAGTIVLDGRDVVADPAFARTGVLDPAAGDSCPINGLTPHQAIELRGPPAAAAGRATSARGRDALVDALDIGEWVEQDGAEAVGRREAARRRSPWPPSSRVASWSSTSRRTTSTPSAGGSCGPRSGPSAETGAAVLLVTHNVVEAERSVDRLAILDHGIVIETERRPSSRSGWPATSASSSSLEPGADRSRLPTSCSRSVERRPAPPARRCHAAAAGRGGGLGGGAPAGRARSRSTASARRPSRTSTSSWSAGPTRSRTATAAPLSPADAPGPPRAAPKEVAGVRAA